MLELDLLIQVHGWALVQVEGDVTSWSYTVGLTENYGHPELAMTTVRLELQSAVIHRLVEGIVETGHLDLDLVAERDLELVEVHPTRFVQEWFGTWSNRYERPPHRWFPADRAARLMVLRVPRLGHSTARPAGA